MADHNLSVMPVIDAEGGRFIGSITSSDVMSAMIGDKPQKRRN
jgi:CBS domain-containing protein